MSNSKIFLVDGSKEFTYSELFERIGRDGYCHKIKQYGSLFEYLVNLIKAFYFNVDITLLDSDFTNKEIEDLGFNNLLNDQTTTVTVIQEIVDVTEFKNRLYKSTSKITLFTSGTTGIPKSVNHTIHSLSRMVRESDKHALDVWALAYNHTHIAGIQVLMQALFNMNTLVNVFNQNPVAIQESIKRYEVTHISATPTFYRLLLNVGLQFTNVERVTFGGEKFDENLQIRLLEVFPNARVNNIYASTELGSLLVSNGSYFQIPQQFKKEIKIESGQLLIHRSLLSHFQKSSEDWYETGDMVEWDQSGDKFKFLHRANDSINIGGYKINPYEIESAMGNVEGVKLAYVYGKNNSVTGKILCADIVTDGEIDIKKIREELATALQDFKIPRIIRKVEKLDLTRTGKLKRIQ